jgi:hypothetical protein
MRDEEPAEFWCRRPEGASSFRRPAELGMLEPRGRGLPNPCDVRLELSGCRAKEFIEFVAAGVEFIRSAVVAKIGDLLEVQISCLLVL